MGRMYAADNYKDKIHCLDIMIDDIDKKFKNIKEDRTHWYWVSQKETLKEIKEDLFRLESLEK